MACCGKMICRGCIHAPVYDDKGNEVDNKKCPFCRTPPPKSAEENLKRLEKRMELNDAEAIYNMGCCYALRRHGLPQNQAKALELFHRAAELGYTGAYYNMGVAYDNGLGVEMDRKKAIHCFELAAMGGDAMARGNLGCTEGNAGNNDRALRHWMIGVKNGDSNSLGYIKQMYKNGHTTKDNFAKALRLYQVYLDEIKSEQRDQAYSPYYESAV